MLIYFGCSHYQLTKHKDIYLALRDTIVEEKHQLTWDWLPKDILAQEKGVRLNPDRGTLYRRVMDGILNADLVIFDCTVQTMALGQQVIFSLNKSKPTLLIMNTKSGNVKNLFISGTSSPYLTMKNYGSKSEAVRILEVYLKNCTPRSKVRFNLVLDRHLNDYAEWATYRYNTTKTDVIKGALETATLNDQDYQQFRKSVL